MDRRILNHYLKFSLFTNAGCYSEFLRDLPDDVRELGNLISHQIIHRVTLKEGNTNANEDKRYGDMDEFPWHRLRCEDDVLPNAVSMIAELLRLDNRGFFPDRKVEDKKLLTQLEKGLIPVLWAVFYDFHSLMNNEVLYLQTPHYIWNRFDIDEISRKDLEEIDELAKLLLSPDDNFDTLLEIWNSKKKFRMLSGSLIGDEDHVRWK